MATISIASDKGGPGKTTTSCLIAAELALDGYRVSLLDCDVTQQAAAFGEKAKLTGLMLLIWTRILPGFESVPVRTVRETVEKRTDTPIFKTSLMERAAYRDIHISGIVPRQKDPRSGPAQNVSAVAAELLASIEKLREAA